MDLKLIFFVGLLLVSLQASNAEASDFNSRVVNLLKEATDNLGIGNCVEDGWLVANQFTSLNVDQKAAVALINIYTQECEITKGKSEDDLFYRQLNKQMAICDNTDDFNFVGFGDLLNDAIDILRLAGYGNLDRTVYRGQCDIKVSVGQQYYPNRFFSTSMSPFVANGFGSNCFIIIEKASGLLVVGMSEFETEEEVLLKSTAGYFVSKYTNDAAEIGNELNELGLVRGQVTTFIRMTQISGYRKRRDISDEVCSLSSKAAKSLSIHNGILWCSMIGIILKFL